MGRLVRPSEAEQYGGLFTPRKQALELNTSCIKTLHSAVSSLGMSHAYLKKIEKLPA
jgi:hypothetical protein